MKMLRLSERSRLRKIEKIVNAVDRKRQKQTDWKFVSQAQGRPTGGKDNKNTQQSSLVNNMSLIRH